MVVTIVIICIVILVILVILTLILASKEELFKHKVEVEKLHNNIK